MIYFFSDAHLGSRAFGDMSTRQAHQAKLIRMLDRMAKDAKAIYILGDLFDYWFEYFWPDSSKDEYAPILTKLNELTHSGIDIHFYIGNHDIWTFRYLRRKTGMTIHRRNAETVTLCGKRVVLGHGDGLVPSNYLQLVPPDFAPKLRHFLWLRRAFHNPFIQFLGRLFPSPWGNRIGYGWARNSRLKEEATPYPYKGENKEETVLWAKEQEQNGPHADYYIFGHRHIELDLLLATGAHVLLIGDTFRQWTYAAMSPDGSVQLTNFEEE